VYRAKLVLVDAVGGALSSMAAAVARAQGRTDVVAATSSELADIPPEVHAVLEEIGLVAEPVISLDRKDREGESLQVIDEAWGAKLWSGEGELERLSNARIARDRIERRVRAMIESPAG
jgi:hypothetical protein